MEQFLTIKPDTTAEELAELIKIGNTNVCKQVAQHPNTSPETLKKLFIKFPTEVLNNPIIDLLLLENSNFFRELYYSNPDCFIYFTLPLFYIEWAINNIEDYWVRCSIAESTTTPLCILEKLALDKDSEVRSCIARNSNISENIVNRLVQDEDTDVLYNLATNYKTSHKNLELLAKHEQSHIRSAVASNKNTPQYILEKLAEDRDTSVVCNVASNLSTSLKTLEKLSQHQAINVLVNVAKNLNTSLETLEKLSQHQVISIRVNVAKNPNISLNIMKQLMKDNEYSVKTALAANKKIPSSLLNELADNVLNNKYNTQIVSIIIHNPNFTPELKQKIDLFYQKNKEKFKLFSESEFDAIKHYTDLEMMRVNWTKEIGRDYLLKTYGKRSRLHLTDAELVEFWDYLMDLPTPDIK